MPDFKKIAVVGIGLIGASLAAALKKSDPELEITAVDKCAESIKKAENLNIIDHGYTEIAGNLREVDLIFIAVPVKLIPQIIKKIKNNNSRQQVIVDAGSTKKEIMLAAEEILKGSNKLFIGGHPMAGSHKSGIDWHDPELFQSAPFILTPYVEPQNKGEEVDFNSKLEPEKKEAINNLKNLIKNIGAKSYIISAAEHDQCTAYLSHLPHLLSSALVNLSQKKEFTNDFLNLSGSGYRDMTRIAGSSAELWQDIILSNRENLVELLKKYISELEALKNDLEADDEKKIYNFLAKAAEIKNNSD